MLQGLPPSLPSVAGEVNQGHLGGGFNSKPRKPNLPNQSFSCSVSHIPTVYIVENVEV